MAKQDGKESIINDRVQKGITYLVVENGKK
jgi:hypothetical protein